MGHATRSLTILNHLLDNDHEIRVVVSGKAHQFLTERLASRANASVEEIHGLTLRYFGNRLDRGQSLYANLRRAPDGIRKNVKVYRKVAEDGFAPQAVVSDFESFAAFYGLKHRVPVISLDNIQILNRCRLDKTVTSGNGFDLRLARLAVKAKMPGAYHYLITSFFYPPIRRRRTTLLPPILRPDVVNAVKEPAAHMLVYQRTIPPRQLVKTLQPLPVTFHVYGTTENHTDHNVVFKSFSGSGFLEDLRTARAVIGGGGFSLMSEAVSLKVPMLSVPIEHQYEQQLNALYLERLGYGTCSHTLTTESLEQFLSRLDEFQQSLDAYERHDNHMVFDCLDELLDGIDKRGKRPNRLVSPAFKKSEADN